MKKLLIFSLAIVGFLIGCDKEEKNDESLDKVWVFHGFNGDDLTYRLTDALEEDKSGYIFKKSGELIARKNSSWCGTPPIHYADFAGMWKYSTNKDTIYADHKSGIGDSKYKIYIAEATPDSVKVRFIYE